MNTNPINRGGSAGKMPTYGELQKAVKELYRKELAALNKNQELPEIDKAAEKLMNLVLSEPARKALHIDLHLGPDKKTV